MSQRPLKAVFFEQQCHQTECSMKLAPTYLIKCCLFDGELGKGKPWQEDYHA